MLTRSLLLLSVALGSVACEAQELSTEQSAAIASRIESILTHNATPSASVAISRGGSLIFQRDFGFAVLADGNRARTPASTEMAYPIGSNSKAFTAACILLLQERGQLHLDDPVAKWFPELTRAKEVTVRNLLTHTSGYADAAPQAYTMPMVTHATTGDHIIHTWATRPLSFDPGTHYEYSNTNYTIAAMIVEKVSQRSFHDFLWQNIIAPLHLKGVLDLDISGQRSLLQVQGYEQHALGPMRPDNLEAPGWYYGAGELAMPVASLLSWDESILHRTLLKPESYDAMETEYKLKDGTGTGYGMALHIDKLANGKKLYRHGGVVSGFVSQNVLFPDDDLAYAALTNDFGGSASKITSAISSILNPDSTGDTISQKANSAQQPKPKTTDNASEQIVRTLLESLQKGAPVRLLLTVDTNFYFDPQTVADFRDSLAPLGKVLTVSMTSEDAESGMVFRTFRARFPTRTIRISTYTMPDGKLEQFLVSAAD